MPRTCSHALSTLYQNAVRLTSDLRSKLRLYSGTEARAEVGVIHLVDHRIEHCRGCETCGDTGQRVIQDDHESICRKPEQALGLIVCSPADV
jgi:hypothetical protein